MGVRRDLGMVDGRRSAEEGVRKQSAGRACTISSTKCTSGLPCLLVAQHWALFPSYLVTGLVFPATQTHAD